MYKYLHVSLLSDICSEHIQSAPHHFPRNSTKTVIFLLLALHYPSELLSQISINQIGTASPVTF